MLEIVWAVVQGQARLHLIGELAIETVDRLEAAAAGLPADVRSVVIDCAGLSFLDSTGVGALLNLAQSLQAAGGMLRLQNLPPLISEVLDTLGLLEMLGAGEEVSPAWLHP